MNLNLRVAILRSLRTQTRLAHVTGIPEWRLSRIVNGWQEPTPAEQQLIANAVGVQREPLFAASDSVGVLAAGAV